MTAEEAKSNTSQGSAASSGDAPKRKRNRNRKKKTNGVGGERQQRQQQAKEGGEQPRQQGSSSLNPHLVLRNDLMAQGFSGEDVDKAMDEMWNKELPYDEYESVLKYLKLGEKAFAKTNAGATSRDKTATSSTAAAEKGPNGMGGGVEESKDDSHEDAVQARAPSMSMAQKLDMVAGNENFVDAAFALTEWVNKAAKPHELEEFCAARKTSALPLILRRSITESEDYQIFESKMLPSIMRLMVAVLKKCNLSPSGVAEARDSFESVVKTARKAYLIQKEECPEPEFADKVADFIASRISLAMDESKFASSNDGQSSHKKLPASSPSLHGGNHAVADSGIREMLSKRDMYKSAAVKSSVAARNALNSMSVGDSSHGNSRDVDTEKADILSALLGEEARVIAQQHKDRLNELKKQIESDEPEHIKDIRESLEEYQSERDSIATRIAELRQSIEKLETYDAELCAKVVDLQAEIDIDSVRRNSTNQGLMNSLHEAQKNVKFNNSVTTLVDMLKSYDESLDKAFNGSDTNDVSNGDAGNKLDLFLFKAKNYFVNESDCTATLRSRARTLEKEIGELKIEISECQGLGMTTTVGQMEESLKRMEEDLDVSKGLVDRFVREANDVFESLLSRLEQHKSIGASNGKSLSVSQNSTLQHISTCISALGLTEPQRLSFYVSKSPPGSTKARRPDETANKESFPNGQTIPPPKTQNSSQVPKFTWAAKKEKVTAAPKASLLDIQQEELKSKSSS